MVKKNIKPYDYSTPECEVVAVSPAGGGILCTSRYGAKTEDIDGTWNDLTGEDKWQ